VSNIFIENMNKLSLYERPIHCTDVKRETLYIKQDEWKKDEQQIIVKDALKQLAFKQARSVSKWKENNPDFLQDDKKKDDFIQITKNVMCDITTEQDKIIKNICKDVHINPNNNDM
jgi:flagellar motility protein MotE (MotC chaperone)